MMKDTLMHGQFQGGKTMINITNCGHDSHHCQPCDIEHENGLSEYLLLIVKTAAWFSLGGTKTVTKPNMAILFDKHSYIHYGYQSPGYNDDWIHFDLNGSDEISWFQSLGLPLNQPLYPPDVQRLSQFIQLMSQESHFPAGHSAQIQDCLMKALLHALSEDLVRASQPVFQNRNYPAFLKLRAALYDNPSAPNSIETMARSLNLSISYFQHLYKQFFSVPPQMDLIQARLNLAKFYLTHSNMNIYALASFCGYSSEVHFMRQFKKFEGTTPSEYRQKHSENA